MQEKFQVQFLEETSELLNDLVEKAQDKIIYNITSLFAFLDYTGNTETVLIPRCGIVKKS